MKEFKTGYIHSIETMGLVDGPGIRVVVFMQGCPLRCVFCHNPETWNKKQNKKMTSKEIVDEFVDFALRQAIVVAKEYPSQLQDLVIVDFVQQFIGIQVAMMVLDKLYENGTFKPLSEDEKVTSNLLMFADRLPE